MLAFTWLLSAGVSAAVLETNVGRFALLDRLERAAVAFGLNVDDSRYAAMGAASERIAVRGGELLCYRPAPGDGTVCTPLPCTSPVRLNRSHTQAGARRRRSRRRDPRAAAGGCRAARLLARNARQPADPAPAVLGARRSLTAGPVLGVIDLFVIWWIVVLAIGMSVLYRRSARRLAVMFLGAYIALAAILAVAMALAGGTA